MKVLAIDPGLVCWAYSLFNDDGKLIDWSTVKMPKASPEFRWWMIFDVLENMIGDIVKKEELVIVTEYQFGNKFSNAMPQTLAVIGAAFGKHAESGKVSIRYISPKSWKLTAMNNSNASKDEVKTFVGNIYPELLKETEHVNDAACMFLAWKENNSIGIKEKKKKKQNVTAKKNVVKATKQ